jgi:N-carbamoylputrescine amidase
MPRKIKVAFVQHSCTEDRSANLKASLDGIQQAAAQGANLIVLQELHTGLYFCQQENTQYFDWAESIPGPTSMELSEICRQLKVVVVASLFEKRAAGLYHNTAVVIETDGKIAGRYRKMHIPDDPGFYEKFYFTPGDLGFNPIDTSVGRLGVLVCWDQWYPEAARLMALGGAELLVYPTAIGWDPGDDKAEQARQRDAWITSQRAHAIANGIAVISCNRVGFEADPSGHGQGIHFWGSSFIAGPQGEILAQASTNQNMTQTATLDLDRSDQIRRIWPFLRDRRIDAYHDILLRYRD